MRESLDPRDSAPRKPRFKATNNMNGRMRMRRLSTIRPRLGKGVSAPTALVNPDISASAEKLTTTLIVVGNRRKRSAGNEPGNTENLLEVVSSYTWDSERVEMSLLVRGTPLLIQREEGWLSFNQASCLFLVSILK